MSRITLPVPSLTTHHGRSAQDKTTPPDDAWVGLIYSQRDGATVLLIDVAVDAINYLVIAAAGGYPCTTCLSMGLLL